MSKNVYERFSVAGDYLVLRTMEKYHKTASGKSWQKKPYAVDREVFKTKNYEWFIQSIPCFNSRAYWNYTVAGYIPTRVTTVSPDREIKQIDSFQFISMYNLRKNAGWREREILDNAVSFEINYLSGRYIVKIYTYLDGDVSSGEFDLATNSWVG